MLSRCYPGVILCYPGAFPWQKNTQATLFLDVPYDPSGSAASYRSNRLPTNII